ncbi:hypothetical protein [Amycolatopsis nigrescens]|uniref:hypothetical protein n=1 Tax=Amycolatopsis nigrescens TaxID=381445 RepID=UPI00058D7C5F|nr:hypothetical protein [Amycolatopsis nigrescens]
MLGSAVLGLGAAMAIAGCGAGQITQTDSQKSGVLGAGAQKGPVSVRNAVVVNRNSCDQAYTPGMDAPLSAQFANTGGADVQLLSVTSEVATGAVIEGSKVVPAGHKLQIDEPGRPGVQQVSEPGASSSSQDQQVGHATITLQGLKRVLWPGQTIKVTFNFSNGAAPASIPIGEPSVQLKCDVPGGEAKEGESGGH